ncbi:MAG TPA: Hsp70 family protein [Stellaceae bacterium]|nr:Hsp70 family protein [Stellaceae bacterium]
MKHKLSEAESATFELVHDGKPIDWSVSRETFERISERSWRGSGRPSSAPCAMPASDELSQIVLAGGASRMPMFRRLVARLFRRLPAQNSNPDEVVARGAAVRAGMQMSDASLEETVLTVVSRFTLGIEVSEETPAGNHVPGFFLPIIERNTVIPASGVKSVVTLKDNQTLLTIEIHQGESRLVKDNIEQGSLLVRVPPGKAGEQAVDVRSTYDTSGLLEVDATVRSTKQARPS